MPQLDEEQNSFPLRRPTMRKADKRVLYGVIAGGLLFLGITGINSTWADAFGISPLQYPVNFIFLLAGVGMIWYLLKRY